MKRAVAWSRAVLVASWMGGQERHPLLGGRCIYAPDGKLFCLLSCIAAASRCRLYSSSYIAVPGSPYYYIAVVPRCRPLLCHLRTLPAYAEAHPQNRSLLLCCLPTSRHPLHILRRAAHDAISFFSSVLTSPPALQ